MVQSFEQFLADNRDEITALQVLYSTPYKSRLRFEDIKELAGLIEKPPHHFRVDSHLGWLRGPGEIKSQGGQWSAYPDRPGFPGPFCHASGE
jgi:hypothetical protein